MKPRAAFLVAFALCLAVLFQWDAFSASPASFAGNEDVIPIQQGYAYAQQHGTAHWWYGKWINGASPYFRPLASYAHYAQVWAMARYGFLAVTVASVVLFSLICTLSGVLAWQISGRFETAPVAASIVAYFHASPQWLGYFPYADNNLSLFFQVVAFCSFIAFARAPRRRWALVATWAAFLASGLCKEAGAFTPLIILAAVLGLPDLKARRLPLGAHLACMTVAGALLVRYARAVTGHRGQLPVIKTSWLALPGHEHFVLTAGALLVIGVAVAAYYRPELFRSPARRAGWLAGGAAWLVLGLTLTPSDGGPFGVYEGFYIMDHANVLFWDAVAMTAACGFAFALYRYPAPILAVLACYLVSTYPWRVSGSSLVAGRVIFIMPYVGAGLAVSLVTGWAWLAERMSARKTNALQPLAPKGAELQRIAH